MLSFIYCTVWKLWHWGCLFFWVSKLLINQSLVFKSIFSVSFYVHHKMKQRTFQCSECSTQLISLQSWAWVTGRIWSALSVLFQCGCLFCTTIQAKINGSRLKAHRHTLCTTLLFLAPKAASHLLFSPRLWQSKLEANRVVSIKLPYFSLNFYFNLVNWNTSV